jgi:hypothetical protein
VLQRHVDHVRRAHHVVLVLAGAGVVLAVLGVLVPAG